ncbi:hypothetical protein [Streptosporangium roseum]|uniref:Uncharacterized protein n=1 Tax=Streptosporangium roseum (strain ATCC 12428 / DSM 43021 / JCM 3005 / KCTC 9067 / NCIMB 10171 / NRRL 2505 / NI 9100) TaxID=479432 RepID=D2ASU7_STRRD|nr:hypothetical protein [Streptosporangium roseum]ACZ90424.1 hypothetical protein Sros_7755 [Streptosporangium roseum DSM 43021]
MPEPDRDLSRKAIAQALADLADTDHLTLVEIAADGVTTFLLHRDDNGRPRGRSWSATWPGLAGERGWDAHPAETREAVLRTARAASSTADVILVAASFADPRAEQALAWLRAAHPAAQVLRAEAPIAALIREVIADDPLTRSYELIVVLVDPDTSRPRLTSRQLFPLGSRPGARTRVALRCEAAGAHGTAFAVVTWQGPKPRLLSVQSAPVAPGRYEVTAELVRPGRVRFTGLPALSPDPRGWDQLVAELPDRPAGGIGPAHLVCAVEVCGADDQVAERLSRARQMISSASGELGGLLRVSLLAYAAHSYDPSAPEFPVRVAAWEAGAGDALNALDALEERGAVARGYPYHPHAAQLEDMLAVVVERLGRADPTPAVILTVGGRPPHPARTDQSRILPCPHRHDWRKLITALRQRQNTVLGAICDQPADQAHQAWHRIGTAALAHLEAVDVRGLAADLGLVAPSPVHFPFPLLDETE